MGTLCVRADSGVAMGTGHVMRCLALAQAWQDKGGDALFAMAHRQPSVEARLQAEGVGVITVEAEAGSLKDAAATAGVARKHGADWMVVDGYQFDATYQEELKRAGLKVLFVDDSGHAGDYAADIVLNQNAHATAELYASRRAHTRLLLGPCYALLRREFRGQRGVPREIPPLARKVLVTMGGSDPENLTLRAIEALGLIAFDEREAVVVVGGSNPHSGSLRAAAAKLGKGIRLLSDVSNMSEWMKWADVAISAAGSTCWEMCFLGLPAVLVDFAPNQTPVAEELNRLGAAVHFGHAASVVPKAMAEAVETLMRSAERRSAMSQTAVELVDGNGAGRVVALLENDFSLRRVEVQDCRLLWDWANDQEVRKASFSSAPIQWDEHVQWFSRKLSDEQCRMFIACDRGEPVGQIRVDRTAACEAEIDISVAPEVRGQGYATRLIDKAAAEAFREMSLSRLHAFIRPANRASARAFERANFRRVGTTSIRGNEALHYVLEREGRTDGE